MTAVIARGSNKNRVWVRYKLLDGQRKEMRIGDVVHTRREKMAFVVENWDDTRVHVKSMCDGGYYLSFFPKVFSLLLVRESDSEKEGTKIT